MSGYVGRISLVVTMGISALFPTSGSNSQIEPTSVKREIDTNENSTQGEHKTLPSSIKQETAPREIDSAPILVESSEVEVDRKEEAKKYWNLANVSNVVGTVQSAIKNMEQSLAKADCKLEDIGLNQNDIRNRCGSLAGEEWERAKTLTVPYFQRHALHEMHAALEAVNLTIADIGVTEKMIRDLQLELRSTDEDAE